MGPIIEKFFRPRSIALIGASSSPGFGYGIPQIWEKCGWLDRATLVNPKGGTIRGKEVVRGVADLPDGIDLAVVIVPAVHVPEVLAELGKKGIQAVIIETAGFAEIGEEGKGKQDELLGIARQYGMRLVGPNCVGIVNTENCLSTVELLETSLEPGSLAIIAQSGVFGGILLDYLPELGLKASKVVTLGNKIDLDEADFLEYLVEDPQTRVILIYEEGARDGRRLLGALQRAGRRKPVIILKSGRTPLGRQATLSHTGSLSGEDKIYDAAFRQAGVVRAADLSEMIDLARVFLSQPPMKGKRIGILTTSGSLGAMAADALYNEGMELSPWAPDTIQKVRNAAPGWMNVKNPLDVGPSGVFPIAAEALFSDPNPDGYMLIPVVPHAIYETWSRLRIEVPQILGDWRVLREQAAGKPVVAVLLGSKEWRSRVLELCGNSIAAVNTPEEAAKALAALYRLGKNSSNGKTFNPKDPPRDPS